MSPAFDFFSSFSFRSVWFSGKNKLEEKKMLNNGEKRMPLFKPFSFSFSGFLGNQMVGCSSILLW